MFLSLKTREAAINKMPQLLTPIPHPSCNLLCPEKTRRPPGALLMHLPFLLGVHCFLLVLTPGPLGVSQLTQLF